jgi:hypothetical protein
LDFVRDDTQALVKTLGPADRRKMDEYMFSIREVEQRMRSPKRTRAKFRHPSTSQLEFRLSFPNM